MAMAWLWTGMVAVSLVFGILTGSVGELGGAALEGATAAVELCVSMAGIMCLWTGVMEVMEQCGLSAALARLFRPLLRRQLPEASRDPETLAAISANLSANLLGLGNAATPLGIRAARRMAQGCGGTASHELCLLVVLNSASIQLLPTTVAGVRSAIRSIFCPPSGPPPCSLSSRGLPRRSCLRGSGGGEGVSLSELVVPVLLCFTACYALGKRVDVYTALTRGAEEGLNVLVHILPSLIAPLPIIGFGVLLVSALLTAVYMFRASGAMEYLGALLAPALERVGIPPEVAPLLFIRPISGSGALAVGSELMATYGPDSYIGRVAAVMLGSSETTFYTIAVYFGSVGIVKTRYTIPASLCADAVMFLTSAAAVRVLMG